jgi:hypothetical protein
MRLGTFIAALYASCAEFDSAAPECDNNKPSTDPSKQKDNAGSAVSHFLHVHAASYAERCRLARVSLVFARLPEFVNAYPE